MVLVGLGGNSRGRSEAEACPTCGHGPAQPVEHDLETCEALIDEVLGLVVLAAGVGLGGGGRLFLQYEGMNPSGSFKDNGMSAAFTHARTIGASLDLLFIAKAIERIGDHAKNIAELIIYIVKGDDVRHMPLAQIESTLKS